MTYTDGSQKIIYGIIALVGVIIIAGILAWSVKTYRFVSSAAATEGTIVALNAGGSHPNIKFNAGEGKEIEYAQNGLIFGYRVGDKAAILYNPQNPQEACVNTFGALWGFQTLGFILGICFVGIACFKLLTLR